MFLRIDLFKNIVGLTIENCSFIEIPLNTSKYIDNEINIKGKKDILVNLKFK